MSDDIAIRVEDLWIRYRTVLDKKQTLRGLLSRIGHRDNGDGHVRVVEAVRGVSFEIPRGSVLGVIGPNGAGKSTLLRGIAGILPPAQGRIEVRGRVSTLLALGVGFNTQLTGRDNIYIGGLAAGLERDEIKDREEEIIGFAGIGDFIDMPLRTYSSGMRGRLAFAVSTTMDPDILLIDEALSAGDAAFRRQAAARMAELCGADSTIVLVSHGLSSIREMADRALWLQQGKIEMAGEPAEVIEAYERYHDVTDQSGATEEM